MRIVVSIVLLVLFLIAGYALFMEAPDVQPGTIQPGGAAPHAEEPEVGSESMVDVVQGAEAPVRTVLVQDPPPAAEATKPEVEPIQYAESLAEGTLITVVLPDGQTPAKHAILTLLREQGMNGAAVGDRLASGASIDAVLDEFGLHYRCDENGQARPAFELGQMFLRADWHRDGVSLRAMLTSREALEASYTLVLQPRLGFEVHVTDMQGRPRAGMEVQLQCWSGQRRHFGDMRALAIAITEKKTGSAFLGNVLKDFEATASKEELQGMEAQIGVKGLFYQPPAAPVDWQLNSPERVELQVPDMGSVRIIALDSEGKPLQSGTILVVPRGEGEAEESYRDLRGIQPISIHGGEASHNVHNVEVGMDLEAFLFLGGGAEPSCRVPFAGPVEAGGEVEVTLQAKELGLTLVARLVDADGNPLANQQVHVVPLEHAAAAPSPSEVHRTQSDADGVIRVEMPELLQWSGDPGLVLLAIQAGLREQHTAQVPMPAVLRPGEWHLGTVVVHPPPVLVAGRVVDTSGKGVHCQLVATQYPAKLNSGGESQSGHQVRWRLQSDRDGYFLLRTDGGAGQVGVKVQGVHYSQTQEVLVTPGTEDIQLVVELAASVTLRLAGVPPDQLRALTLVLTETSSQKPSSFHPFNSDPVGILEGIAPGRYTLSLIVGFEFANKADNELWSEEVELSVGQVLDLGQITPQSAIYTYTVRLRIPAGTEAKHYWVASGYAGRVSVPIDSTTNVDGTISVYSLTPVDHIAIHYKVPRKAPTRYPVVEGYNEIEIEQ
ncbi:MAG: hypothetical protein GY930_01430 [bacterium]|nr:hypothetical protein [bacterium]